MELGLREVGLPRNCPWPNNTWSCLEAALFYARRGWRIIPVNRKKQASIEEWQYYASANETKIRAWYRQFPEANVAALMRRSLQPRSHRHRRKERGAWHSQRDNIAGRARPLRELLDRVHAERRPSLFLSA
jgi:Bifunctional DNA primase/polymerase, N-terminal